LLEPQIALR